MSNLNLIDIYNFENCICKNLKMTSRLITQFYDKIFHPIGLRSTQFSLLAVIMSHDNISIGELADILLMDQTTVTRNVEILRKNGYINVRIGEDDSRKRYISINKKGKEKLNEATLLWKKAQFQIKEKIGIDKFEELLKILVFINDQF
ncbi:MarR family winged helix-turn-helix transcriptional regulator [Clostridium sp. Mt-5]|uniref:MarR family winged helix-turn-helix transcriptional regulator n=1 Tax=Clostridium moutaii TaxID=3240932 RepID=A0ABV4BQQ3_9CLOT